MRHEPLTPKGSKQEQFFELQLHGQVEIELQEKWL